MQFRCARRHFKIVKLCTVHSCGVLLNELDVVGACELCDEYFHKIGFPMTLNLTDEWRENHPFTLQIAHDWADMDSL